MLFAQRIGSLFLWYYHLSGSVLRNGDEDNLQGSSGKIKMQWAKINYFNNYLTCVWKKCRHNCIVFSKTEPICPKEQGYCVNAYGKDQNKGVRKLNGWKAWNDELNKESGGTWEGQRECLRLCRSVQGATGCEVVWNVANRGCYAHTSYLIHHGNGEANHVCWVFSKCDGMLFGNVNYINFPILCSNMRVYK